MSVEERRLKKHVDDAAIAAQLPPTTDAQFLAKCRAVEIARRAIIGIYAEHASPRRLDH